MHPTSNEPSYFDVMCDVDGLMKDDSLFLVGDSLAPIDPVMSDRDADGLTTEDRLLLQDPLAPIITNRDADGGLTKDGSMLRSDPFAPIDPISSDCVDGHAIDNASSSPSPSPPLNPNELEHALKELVSLPDEEFETVKSLEVETSAHISDEDETTTTSTSRESVPPPETSLEHELTPLEDDDSIDIGTVPVVSNAPLPHPSCDKTDSLIARLMSKLSMKDREDVYYDIHGVADAIEMNCEEGFVDRKLNEMGISIQDMNAEDRTAYEMARKLNAKYVDRRELRLRFLRADRFDHQRAALRYVRHYQLKLELFGPDKLGRDIIQDDLDDEALDNLYCGLNQVLPKRDNAGRLVWLFVANPLEQAYSREAIYRRIFYNNMLISEDVESQRKGTAGIVYTLNQQQHYQGDNGRRRIENYSSITRALPMSIASVHFVYNNYAWLPVLSIAQMSAHLFIRLRVRSHFGSHSECIYKLNTFGIPAETVPIDEEGNFCCDNHNRYLENRRTQEREWAAKEATENEIESNKCAQTIAPTAADVLLGRGSGFFNHAGNVRYRTMIEDMKELYDGSSNEGKQQTAAEVIKKVHELGGRFLKRKDRSVWIEVDDEVARQKVGHSFRALRPAGQQKLKASKKSVRGCKERKVYPYSVTTTKRIRSVS